MIALALEGSWPRRQRGVAGAMALAVRPIGKPLARLGQVDPKDPADSQV